MPICSARFFFFPPSSPSHLPCSSPSRPFLRFSFCPLFSFPCPPAWMQSWETGAHYQLVHSAVLCMCGAFGSQVSARTSNLFAAGMVLFSGSIYGLVLTRFKLLGVCVCVCEGEKEGRACACVKEFWLHMAWSIEASAGGLLVCPTFTKEKSSPKCHPSYLPTNRSRDANRRPVASWRLGLTRC